MTKIKNFSFINIALFILFPIIIIYCKPINNKKLGDNSRVLYFDVENWDKNSVIPQDIVRSVSFIPLETNANCLITRVRKIIPFNDKYYILDAPQSNNTVFIFDFSGKFLGTIGKYGYGPGEFIMLSDFVVDKKRNQGYILDMQLRKVLIFKLNSGEFIGELKFDFLTNNFAMPDYEVFSFNLNNFDSKIAPGSYSIVITDRKISNQQSFVPKNEYDPNFGYNHHFFQSENTYWTSAFGDTVYKVTPTQCLPSIVLNYGKSKIPAKELRIDGNEGHRHLVQLFTSDRWMNGIENVWENENFITYNFRLHRTGTLVIYSKQTGNYHYGSAYGGSMKHFWNIINLAVSGDEFIVPIEAFHFKRMSKQIQREEPDYYRETYSEVDNSITYNSNPVLMLIEYNVF